MCNVQICVMCVVIVFVMMLLLFEILLFFPVMQQYMPRQMQALKLSNFWMMFLVSIRIPVK